MDIIDKLIKRRIKHGLGDIYKIVDTTNTYKEHKGKLCKLIDMKSKSTCMSCKSKERKYCDKVHDYNCFNFQMINEPNKTVWSCYCEAIRVKKGFK